MFFRLAVIAAVLATACTASPYDVSFSKLLVNPATKQSLFSGVATFSNGDAAVGGRTNGQIGSSSYGGFDFLVQRYSSAGALVWTRQIGGDDVDVVTAVYVDASDNVFVLGFTYGNYDGQTSALLTRSDSIFSKIDSAGNKIYSKQVGGNHEDAAYGAVVDIASDTLYIPGAFYGTNFHGSATVGVRDGYVMKLSADTGNYVTHYQFGVVSKSTLFNAIAQDSFGNLWVAGATDAATYLSQTNSGSNDMLVQKLSPAGVTLFVALVGGTASDTASAIAIDSSNMVYCAGSAASTTIDGQTSAGGQSILVVKFNIDGVKQWTKLLGGAGSDSATGVAVDSAYGLVYLTGTTASTTFHGVSNPSSSSAFLLAIDSANGNVQYAAIYPSTTGAASASAISARAGRIYMSGTTTGNFYGQTFTGVTNDAFLLGLEGQAVLSTTSAPSVAPSATPTVAPSANPLANPTANPTASSTASPSALPTAAPSAHPTAGPTVNPTVAPSADPSAGPTVDPTATPSADPSAGPTADPTAAPSAVPSAGPTVDPSAAPSVYPTAAPSAHPTASPTVDPSAAPSADPTAAPSAVPSAGPTVDPSAAPSVDPTAAPSADPSADPTVDPSAGPTVDPTAAPSVDPSAGPTVDPSAGPTVDPTAAPSVDPSAGPTVDPSAGPTVSPTAAPSADPSAGPTVDPTAAPSADPSAGPTADPTEAPSLSPTLTPTASPTRVCLQILGRPVLPPAAESIACAKAPTLKR